MAKRTATTKNEATTFADCQTHGMRGHQRAPELHEQLVARHSVGLAIGKRCRLVFRCRGSFCHDLQIFARRRDLVERRMDRSRGDSAAFYRRKIRYRCLPWKNCDGERVWSGGGAWGAAVLWVFFFSYQLFWGGDFSGFCRPRCDMQT